MVVLIVGALTETLVKHMFSKYLNEMDKVEIGGAPSWYMVPIKNQMCVFTHQKGSLDSVEYAKNKARFKMKRKIDDTIEIVVYDNLKNIQNEKEQAIVDKFKKDAHLPVFVDKHLNFSMTTYEDEISTAFVRACIPLDTVVDYQKGRLQKIHKEVVKHKANVGFDELDQSVGNTKNDNHDDPFSELESIKY